MMKVTLAATAFLAPLVSGQLQYGENHWATVKDPKIIAENFPEVNITLKSPAFLNPEDIPETFMNGTDGPTPLHVMDNFIQTLALRNDWLSYEAADFLSEEGRSIPYIFLSKPGNAKPSKDKLRVYLQGEIHGNEPAGNEALLALLGKMDADPKWTDSILDEMDIKILPRYNVDGVEYFQRFLACSLDPNRDHIKLIRKQTRDIKRVFNAWNPHIAVDLHEFTADRIYGGYYRHGADALLSGGINQNIHSSIRKELLDTFIPAITDKLEEYDLRWEPYITGPTNTTEGSPIVLTEAVTDARTGRNAMGLTQTLSFLLEMRGIRIADQHFQRRVATALLKLTTILETARDTDIKDIVEDAREDFINSDDEIVVTDEYVLEDDVTFTFIDINNGSVAHPVVEFWSTTPSVANLTRERPEGYIIPRTYYDVVEKLEVLGIEVERLNYQYSGPINALNITSSSVDNEPFEGQYLNTVTTKAVQRDIVLPAGSYYVSTRQKNAALAFIALEPENVDSFVAYNIIPVTNGAEYPVFRVPRKEGSN